MRLVVYIALVVLAVVVAQIYVPSATPEVTIEEELLESMKSISGGSSSLQGAPVYYKKVAIGYNTNTDLVTNAVAVAKALGHEKPPEFEKPANRISNIHDFLALLGYFMTDGSAVERVITDYDTCRTIVDAARLTEGSEHIGGNAALIAMRMADKVNVALAGNLPLNLKNQLHPNIRLLEGAEAPNPAEAHLILEYKKGETWGDIIAPRANRVIVHCDRTNAELKVLPYFHQVVNPTSDLIVISGLHLLDQETTETQKIQLDNMLNMISEASLSPKIPVHLELASTGNLDFVEYLGRNAIPNVNSIGLNEQELGFLYFSLTHPRSEARNSDAAEYVRQHFKDPSIEKAIEALEHILSLPQINSTPHRSLDRVHFHSLKFHIIATRKNKSWQDATIGAVQGSLAASQNACGVSSLSQLQPSHLELLLSDPSVTQTSTTILTRGDIQYTVAPVLVCKLPSRTVGLGDAISAAGLLYQEFKHVQ